MTRNQSLDTDRRAAVTALSHALTLGMTSLLILALLLGTTGFLDSQRSVTAQDELRTIGNRLAGELGQVDELGQQGGSVNLTATHPDRVAGSTYDVQLKTGPGECDGAQTCIVLTTSEFDIQETVPIHNETALTVTHPGGGEFRLHSVGTSTSVGAQFTSVDMSSRIGVGEDVNRDSYETLGTPGNDPPLADFDIFPDWPEAGNQVRFDARPSYDRDGNITEYRWDFDNDGNFSITGADPLAITTLPAGRHNVTLEVVDDGSSVSNFTQEIDVSGLAYLGDLDPTSTPTNGVTFTVENRFSDPVSIERVRIDPADDSLDRLDHFGGEEVRVHPLTSGGWEEIDDSNGFDIHDGGRLLSFGIHGDPPHNSPMIQPGEKAEVTLASFPANMEGKRLTVGLRYTINGTPNATIVNDTVGGPEITNYQVFPSGQDVDVQFESSEPLTAIDVQLGGDVSGTLDRSDFVETGTGPYFYRADVSSGSDGTFWANMTDAGSFGTPTDDTPLNDTALVTGSLVWKSFGDWDNAVSESGVVHASFGDHDADNLSVGYSADGNGLVGYWPLDTTGNAWDRSGQNNHGSVNGNPIQANGIGVSSSYHFDPSNNDYVEVPNDPSLELGDTDEVTVSAWVNKDSAQSGWRAIVQHSDESFNMQFQNGNEPRFTIHDDGNWVSAERPGSVSSNQWYHFVGLYDGSEIRFYVDGVVPAADTATVDDMDETTEPLGIGENLDAPGRVLDGKIDEVRIYDRAIDPDEVQQLYFAARNGKMETNEKVHSSGDVDVSNLELQYNTTKAGGQSIEVKVHSDEGEESPWVSVGDGDGKTSVPGLSTDTDTFHLEIMMESPTPTQSPVIHELALN
jgi:hypothetical protein